MNLDGAEWRVRAVGRARVRSGGGGTPILQLVFRSDEGVEVEALAVGRTLTDLSESSIAEALRQSRPYSPDRGQAPFFESTRQGSGRG